MKRSVGRGQAPPAGSRGGGADEDERPDAIGVRECEQLGEGPARRDADDVGGGDPVRVEDAAGVRHQVGAGVRRAPRLVGHRAAGVAVVVADDEAAALGQPPAEALLPPEHRRADAHHQEDGRVARIAERLRAELDAVRLDHPLHRYQPAYGASFASSKRPASTSERACSKSASASSTSAAVMVSGGVISMTLPCRPA